MTRKGFVSAMFSALLVVPLVLSAFPAGAEDDGWALSGLNPVPSDRTLYTAAWKPLGAYALIGGERGTLLACNGTDFIRFGSGTQESLRAAAWSPGATNALLAGNAGTVRAFDGTAATPVLPAFAGDLRAACWSPDGNQALLVGTGGMALNFNGTLSSLSSGATTDLLGAAWAPNGSYALVVGRMAGGFAVVLRYNGTGLSPVTNNIAMDLRAVAWNPNGTEALVVGNSGRAYRFDGSAFTRVNSPSGQNLQGVAWAPNGTMALICGDGGTVLRYFGGALSPVPSGTGSTLYSVTWESSGGLALLVGSGGTVLRYSAGAVSRVSSSATVQDLNDVEWRPDGTEALLVGDGGTVLKYDGQSFTTVTSIGNQDLRGISWHPNGASALIVGERTFGGNPQWRILHYDAATSSISSLQGPPNAQNLWDVAYNPNGTQALLVGNNHVVLGYDGLAVTNLNCPIGSEWHGVDWNPNGSDALLVGDRAPEIVRAISGTPWAFSPVSNGLYSDLNRVQWRNSTYALITGRVDQTPPNDGTLLGYDLSQGTPLVELASGAPDELWGIGWKPGGNYSLVAGLASTVLKFDLTASADLQAPTGEDLLGVSWRPDGTYALLVGTGGIVLKWSPSGFSFANMPPAVAITAPSEAATVKGTVAVTGTAPDPDAAPQELRTGLVWVDDGAPFAPDGLANWNFSWDTTALPDGNHTLSAIALDSWSNSSVERVTVNVANPVNHAPAVNITSPVQGARVLGTVNITGKAADPDDGDSVVRVMVKTGTSDWVNASGTTDWYLPWDTTAVPDGNCTLSAISYDSNALLASPEFSINVSVQNAIGPDLPPVVAIDAPAENATVNGTVEVRGTASDPDPADTITTVFVRIDASGNWTMAVGTLSWSYSWNTTQFTNGPHVIYARAINDRLNFSSEAVRNVTVGNVNSPPVVAITAPLDGATVQGLVAVAGTAFDPDGAVSSVFVRIDSGSWMAPTGTASWSFTWNTTTVLNGQHSIAAIAFDGTLNSTQVLVGVTVDNPAPAPPVATIVSISPSPALTGERVFFAGRGQSNGTIVAYRWNSSLDGQLSTAAEFNTTALSAGSHTIRFWVQDNSGQWSAEATAMLQVTASIPGSRVFSLNAGGDKAGEPGKPLTFRGTATVSAGRIVRYQWDFGDGQNWTSGNWSEARHAYAKAGTYKANFQVWDERGNSASAQINVVVKAPATSKTDNTPFIVVAVLLFAMLLIMMLLAFRAREKKPENP